MSSKSVKSEGFFETVKTVFYALLIAGLFRTLFFQPFWIPSGSMKDTLLVGDFLFVNKMVYGYSKFSCPFSLCPISERILAGSPSRGDVVVFRHPVSGQDYIKRLIGLPGDKVQVKNGIIFLNGNEQTQVSMGNFEEAYERQGSVGGFPACANNGLIIGSICTKEKNLEILESSPEHSVLNIRNGRFGDNTLVFVVPKGHFFFMGDNRDNSVDSRFSQSSGGVGFVPFSHLLGRADRILFSSSGRSMLYFWTWRKDRFLKPIY